MTHATQPEPRLTDQDVQGIFEEAGALLDGHFVLTSGYHSNRYFEKFHVLRHPRHVEALCRELAARAAPLRPDVVLGPTTLGVLLAYETAKHHGVPAAYAERAKDGEAAATARTLRRPEHLQAGQRVLVVDDVLTTGGSIRECIDLVHAHNATLCGVGVLVDRSGGMINFGAPLLALLSLDVEKWAPNAVPDWLAAIPIARPGSTGKK